MKRVFSVFSSLITITIPFFLVMTSIRLMFTPAFLQFEYNRPGFPVDTFGFSAADRLKYGSISMEYLFNRSPIGFLASVQKPDGTPLYDSRELSHMLDVKILLQNMIIAWIVIALLLLILGFWFIRSGRKSNFWIAFSRGGWLTIGLIAAILLGVALSFNWLFTNFHLIFFTGDTWLFSYSDSLIRLFPLQLWQDAFVGMGVLTLLLAAIFIWSGTRFAKS